LRTKSGKLIFQILTAVLVLQVVFVSERLFARQSKDIILVLDTSMSMVGQAGGKNIFENVKKSIIDYIDKNVQDGDRFVYVTFDTDAKIYPPVLVDDDNDRDILKKYISMSQATGLWTNTYKMIYRVFEEAEKLEKEKKGRKTEIVIMTDAIDDPAPGEAKKFNLAEFAQKYGKKADVWVYILSFTNMENSEAAKKLGVSVGQVTEKVKIIETKEPQKGKELLVEEQKKSEPLSLSLSGKILIPLICAIAVILLVLGIIYLIKNASTLKIFGRLEFWNNEIIAPVIQHFDLAKRPVKEAIIGKGFGHTINIRDINIKAPLAIKAVKRAGSVRMMILGGKDTNIEMVNREADNILQNGDVFKAGNYTFKYFTE
jgi:hypothetical protein